MTEQHCSSLSPGTSGRILCSKVTTWAVMGFQVLIQEEECRLMETRQASWPAGVLAWISSGAMRGALCEGMAERCSRLRATLSSPWRSARSSAGSRPPPPAGGRVASGEATPP